jgi:type II restriction enzyme
MKYHLIFQDILGCSSESDTFHYLTNNFVDSITAWDYFVDWKKAEYNLKQIEVQLNILNYLIGKDNVEEEFSNLISRHPEIIQAIPILIACREHEFKILTDYQNNNLLYDVYNLTQYNNNPIHQEDILKIVEFVKKSGILSLFRDRKVKNIPDYVLGIEVGLDTNARKNRTGSFMEEVVNKILVRICQLHGFILLKQANSSLIKESLGFELKIDKSSRRFDFAIKNGAFLYLIETNFYRGGGSKLKATAGEYKNMYDMINDQGYRFIWITDGLGWKSALKPLEEAFQHIDYILNLKMVTSGLLSQIILNKL